MYAYVYISRRYIIINFYEVSKEWNSVRMRTSSFLYPAEFLSGVASYEKLHSALHR